MKIKNIDLIDRENILKEAEILKILASKEMTFNDLKDLNTKDLKDLFGENIYQSYLNFLRDTKNGSITKENIELFKYKLSFILDIFFDKNPHNDIGEHLRDRQKKAVIKIFNFLFSSAEDTGYVHFPTSTGKTVIFGDVIKNILSQAPNKKILITVPNLEALKRAKKEFEKIGINSSLYFGDEKDLSQNVVIGTPQSLMGALNKQEINSKTFDLMICDEAHQNYLGEKTSEFIEHFSCKKIGFTASPELKDKNVENLFKEKIDEYLLDEAIKDGVLPQIKTGKVYKIKNSEFDKLEIENGEYTQKSLDNFDVRETFPEILESLKNGELKGKQIAIFLPSIALSKELSEYLKNNGIKTEHIDGQSQNREEIQESFENKDIQVICNCEVLKASWDSDIIDGVIILKPTLSPANYIQMIGRALHGKTISENGEKVQKDEIIVSDLVNSEPEIVSRHITVRGLKKLVNLTRGADSEIISLVQNEYISEILLYYDLEEIFSIEGLESIYTEFALKYDLEIEEFLEKLETERESLEQENHTIILKLKSNNKFGNTYADREKEFEFDLKTLRNILKIYKKESLEKEILKKESSKGKAKIYFETKIEEDFRKDLENITNFVTTNKTDKIKGLSFFQIYDGYLNYRLGIKQQKERIKYRGTIVRLLKEFKNGGKLPDLETLKKEYETKK